MQINLPDDAYQAIAATNQNVEAFLTQVVNNALKQPSDPLLDESKALATNLSAEQQQSIRNDLKRLRGTLRDTTIEEICEDRHRGLR